MDRKEICKKAIQERWNPTVPKAFKSGTLKLGNTEIPCAIVKMSNGEIVRLLTQNGMIKALGRKKGGLQKESGGEMPVFLGAENLKSFITNEIVAGGTPIEFKLEKGGRALGYRAEFLAHICGVYLDAERHGKLLPQQQNIAAVCSVLQKAFATVGLISLVDEVCGYQKIRDSDALQQILQKFLSKEQAKWAKQFPSEFYEQIYRLRNWAPYSDSKNKYSCVGYYTKDLVYERLAPGLLEEMKRIIPRNDEGKKKGTYHQLLTNDYGIPKLKEHFSALVAIMKLSKNWEQLIENANVVLPKTIELEEIKEIQDERRDF